MEGERLGGREKKRKRVPPMEQQNDEMCYLMGERSELKVTEKASTIKGVVIVKIFLPLKQAFCSALDHWERCLGVKTPPTEDSIL